MFIKLIAVICKLAFEEIYESNKINTRKGIFFYQERAKKAEIESNSKKSIAINRHNYNVY